MRYWLESRWLIGVLVCALSAVEAAALNAPVPAFQALKKKAAEPPPPPAERSSLLKANAGQARDKAKQAREQLEALAAQRKQLQASIKLEQAELAKHSRAAQTAYPLLPAVAAPPKLTPGALRANKPKPLPRVEALQTAKKEYAEVLKAGAALSKYNAALQRAEEDANRKNDAASEAAASAKGVAREAQENAKTDSKLAKDSDDLAKKQKTDTAAKAAQAMKAHAETVNADAKEAQAASAAAEQEAGKSRALFGLAGPAFAAKKAVAQKDDAKLKADLEAAQRTALVVERELNLQSPAIKGCDLKNVDFKNMSYPWIPYGSAAKPLKLTNGSYVCDEANESDCPGTPPGIEEALIGDLVGDGSQHAVVQIFEGSTDAPAWEILFFVKDADCHLRLLKDEPYTSRTGEITGHTFAADLVYAKKGQNIGFGDATGLMHSEWRVVKGQVKRTDKIVE